MRLMSSLLLTMALAGCVKPGIPNLAQVSPGIWRGGQPKTIADWQQLQSLGIKRVIKLNEDYEAQDVDGLPNNTAWELIKIPISPELQIVGGLELSSKIELAVSYMFTNSAINASRPVFIHCSHGQDRTGLAVAVYRLQHGWSKADAEKEMLAMGFHRSLFGLWNFWKGLRDFK